MTNFNDSHVYVAQEVNKLLIARINRPFIVEWFEYNVQTKNYRLSILVDNQVVFAYGKNIHKVVEECVMYYNKLKFMDKSKRPHFTSDRLLYKDLVFITK